MKVNIYIFHIEKRVPQEYHLKYYMVKIFHIVFIMDSTKKQKWADSVRILITKKGN